jgi:hypothetical protein
MSFVFTGVFCSIGLSSAPASAELAPAPQLEALAPAPDAPSKASPLGAPLNESRLGDMRGGDLHINQQDLSANLSDTRASNLTTGSNTIGGGSFANSNGLPIVIQNSGNGVVIQNSTILNLNVK